MCTMYLAIFVDDLLLCGGNDREVQAVINTLNQKFKLKDLGPIHEYLSVCIDRGPQGALLCHVFYRVTNHLQKLLSQYTKL